jgi:ABC-type transport system involved in cytochrome bd biosynthesis fused ATPase/permease subunit
MHVLAVDGWLKQTEGESDVMNRNSSNIKNIGIITAGGDCGGLNAVVRGAAKILVLTENGLEEQGTHAELMAKGGVYAGLYSMYAEI